MQLISSYYISSPYVWEIIYHKINQNVPEKSKFVGYGDPSPYGIPHVYTNHAKWSIMPTGLHLSYYVKVKCILLEVILHATTTVIQIVQMSEAISHAAATTIQIIWSNDIVQMAYTSYLYTADMNPIADFKGN